MSLALLSFARTDRGAECLPSEHLCTQAAEDIEKLRDVLMAVNHTLCVHGKIDGGTPLHSRIVKIISETL